MPSVPARIATRPEALRPTGGREYTNYDSAECYFASVAPGGTFAEVAHFAGRPDAIMVTVAGTDQLRLRFSNSGETPIAVFAVECPFSQTFPFGYQIVEAAIIGATSHVVSITGVYGSRHIERRVSRYGPRQTHVHPHEDQAAEQVEQG